MKMKVRTGYAFKSHQPGAIVELTEEEYQSQHWKFEPVTRVVAKKVEPPDDEPQNGEGPEEQEVLENRAVLDSTAGAPIMRRGGRAGGGKKK